MPPVLVDLDVVPADVGHGKFPGAVGVFIFL
jgi:hypothetical protein